MMTGRVFLITGSTDGIGKHTAHLIAKLGATVLVHGRSPERVQLTQLEVQQQSGNANVHGYVADFASLEGVRQLSRDIHQNHSSLDVLINNAGVLETKRMESADGYEMTFAVNVLSPFYLTSLLLDLLKKGNAPRLINVASISQACRIDFDDLQFQMNYGNGVPAYELSKLCNIMFTYMMAEKFQPCGMTVNTLDPGTVNTKMLLKSWGAIGVSVDEADYEYNLATSSAYDNVTGKYFVYNQDAMSSHVSYDKKKQQKLWDILVKITGAKFD
ncbi:retinol dehydrogenase 13-like [Apostichopus japonicus]|uniref:retinol dehydrogenase 13-like n=1 Tax=Stichopus japonicus TaxID=307972 RepID=UPI003AB6B47F